MRFENIFGRRTLAKVNRELLSYDIGLLKEFLADTIGRNTEMTVRSLQKGIFSPESEFLKRGGKRWRVALFDTVVDILGGSKNDLRKYSVVCELIHNGTLIADDIEDGSLLRRGKPSLHLIYGTDISVNLSQFLYFFPLVPLLEIRDHGLFARLMKIYTEEMISVSAGQAIDIVWHRGLSEIEKITYSDYLSMCAMKTGSLARMSARMACAFVNTDDKTERLIADFATSLGVAFQIKDDILDITRSELSRLKGGRGNDITEGKITLIVLRTLKKARASYKRRLVEILRAHTTERLRIEEAINIINRYDGISFSLRTARSTLDNSLRILERKFKKREIKRFSDFADFCLNRDI